MIAKLKAWLIALIQSILGVPQKASGLIEHIQKDWDATMYSQNIKHLVMNDAATANMHEADQIVELGVGAILVGGFELYGIQMIINATGLTGVVQTMFQPSSLY